MIFSQAAGDRKVRAFSLSSSFLEEFHGKQPNWGPVGYFTFKRTYARELPEGGTEEFWQTCKRVVEGCFQIQKIHCRRMALPWNEAKGQNSAQEMFRRMFDFKFTPPGRGLWMMGTDVVYSRGSAALQNCAFVSTDKLAEDFSGPFTFLMDLSMLGVGVGGDTRGKGAVRIQRPDMSVTPYVVDDSREGWVDLVRTLLESFVGKAQYPRVIDYSPVRGRGAAISTFGGVASGPLPLQKLVEGITKILLPKGVRAEFDVDYDEATGKIGNVIVTFKGKKAPTPYRIGSAQIVDVFNYIGKCVVAGGVRRTAEIMFGEPDDEDFVTLKQDEEALNDRRWASNNSVFGYVGMDYTDIVDSIAKNGEPGICWLENARAYSRMGHPADNKDWRVVGTNPCGEQSLESFELCNLVETYPAHHDDYDDYERTLKMAYLYAKTVTLVPTHIPRANAVMQRNRRIGCSMSGITQAMAKLGRRSFLNWCDEGYDYVQRLDRIYSEWLGCGLSVKTTTVKPSGCQVQGTLINTEKGNFRLSELGDVQGEMWQDISGWTSLGKNITKFFVNGDGPTKQLRTEDGNLLEGSLPHQYQVVVDGDVVWKKVADIVVGDQLLVSLGDYQNKTEPSLFQVPAPYHNTKSILQPKEMSPALAWFLGMLYGDGSVHKKGLRISFNRKEASLVHFISQTVKSLFGLDALVDDDHSIYINSTHLLAYLEANHMLKDFSHSLEMPLAIRSAGVDSIKAFITGLWRADGAIYNRSTWGICTVSEGFARDLLVLCRAVGFNVKLKNAGPGGWGSRDRWLITSRMGEPDLLRYVSRELRERVFGEGLWLDPVVDVTDSYSPTFDIEVPDTKEYVANGVLSHNTVSLLCGATPGIHYPHSEFYIRHIRVQNTSPLVQAARDAGFDVHPDPYADDTSVVAFPVRENHFTKGKAEVTVWEQYLNAEDLQKHWADNQVSVTITFTKDEVRDLKPALEAFEDRLKGISMLPLADEDHGYQFAPYQEIDEEQYASMVARTKAIDFGGADTHDKDSEDKFCTGEACTILPPK